MTDLNESCAIGSFESYDIINVSNMNQDDNVLNLIDEIKIKSKYNRDIIIRRAKADYETSYIEMLAEILDLINSFLRRKLTISYFYLRMSTRELPLIYMISTYT